jgi:hypothetical protein
MTRPDTRDPFESALEPRELAEAFVLAVMLLTVTSPPKIESVETWVEALAVVDAPGVAKAPDVTEPAVTTEPSPG